MIRLAFKTLKYIRAHGLRSTVARIAERINTRRQRPEMGEMLRTILASPIFDLSHYKIEGDVLTIHGSCIPLDGDFSRYAFAVDGRPVETVEYPRRNKTLASRYWYSAHARDAEYVLRLKLRNTPPRKEEGYRLALLDRATGREIYPFRSFHIPKSLHHFEGLPEPERLKRVTGATEYGPFVFIAYTHFKLYQQLVAEVAKKDWASFSNILDWGCGCGRLTRHILRECDGRARVVGADVDADNVAWCARHLNGGQFVPLELNPPSPFPDASFDLILGHSVMTHLDERSQYAWLEELHRISQPNATVILTIQGRMTFAYSPMSVKGFQELRRKGIDASHVDRVMTGFISDPEYYRATFHTHDYIRKTWSKYFKIEDIVEYVFSNQDAVVMTRVA